MVPRRDLVAVVELHDSKVGLEIGRPPLPLEQMLRIDFFSCSRTRRIPRSRRRSAHSVSMHEFVGFGSGSEAALNQTTVCKFRH